MKKINSIYIHYPFCKSKCYYCSFYSVYHNKKLSKKYLKSLEKEFIKYSKEFDLNDLETIYIGGGNPAINLNDLKKINIILSEFVNLSKIKEYTIESNPVNINKKFIKLLKNNSCNRVSLGIQSLNKKVTSYCNRKKQNLNLIRNSLKLLDKNNFNISIDLINGLPLTDHKFELYNLDLILKKYKNIKHISFYDLSIEKGSKFYNSTNIKYLNEKEMIEYQNGFKKIIKKNGFKRYEVSNYAKYKNYCLHNLNYWNYKNYLGLGPSAHSKINSLRIENKSDILNYINSNDYKISYNLTKKELIEEYILMGFRLIRGINIEDFYNKFNISIKDMFNKTIEKYIKIRMINFNKLNIKVNNRGLNILNRILVDLFNELDYKEKNNYI